MAGYLGSTPVPQATQHRESFTATEGQTSFATAGYTPQFLDVFLNGSHLSPADFVATNSSDVVLVVAASADDICDIVSYTPFEVADATFTGTTTTDVSLTTGVLTANGGAVFNEGSASVDFRVESNSDTAALFVKGAGEAIVGIGNGSPTSPNDATDFLHIGSAQNQDTSIVLQDATEIWEIYNNDNLFFKFDTTTVMQMNRLTGEVTMPLQPAFLVRPSSAQHNLAENTVIAFGTEIFDQGADFSSNTFTAPVTGRYQIQAGVRISPLDTAATWNRIELIMSNRSYNSAIMDPGVLSSDPVYWHFNVSVLADMDAGDTAQLRWGQSGGTTQVDVDVDSHFSGFLAC